MTQETSTLERNETGENTPKYQNQLTFRLIDISIDPEKENHAFMNGSITVSVKSTNIQRFFSVKDQTNPDGTIQNDRNGNPLNPRTKLKELHEQVKSGKLNPNDIFITGHFGKFIDPKSGKQYERFFIKFVSTQQERQAFFESKNNARKNQEQKQDQTPKDNETKTQAPEKKTPTKKTPVKKETEAKTPAKKAQAKKTKTRDDNIPF